MTESYLTLKQAAQSCGLPYAALRREIERGRLPACRVGRKYFLSAQELRQWQANQQQPPLDGYTVRQIQEILPLSYAYVIELIRSGRLHGVKQGRQYVVAKTELDRFLQEAAAK